MIELARACQLFAGKEVNIYTNSRYAHGVVWDHGVIWLHRGYVAADGKSISHSDLVTALLDAIQLPSKLAIMHCKAHTGQMTDIAKGNALADRIAKETAQKANIQMPMLTPQPCSLKEAHWLTELQAFATPDDIVQWNCDGIVQKDPKTGLICQEGRPCIPVASTPLFIAQYHGLGHRGW